MKALMIFILLLPLIPLSGLVKLDGHVVSPPRPKFNWESIRRGETQEAIEKDFARHFGAFNFLVKLDNSLNFAFKETNLNQSHCVAVGNNGVFLSPDEIAQRNVATLDWGKIEVGLVGMSIAIERLQAAGVKVAVLFVPSKLRYYPSAIPERWKSGNPSDEEPEIQKIGEKALDKIRELGLPVLDTRIILGDVLTETSMTPIPKGGRHWNDLTSCRILAKFVYPELKCEITGLEPAKKNEQDVARCLNRFAPFGAPEEVPAFKVPEGYKAASPKKVLFVGSSFMRELESQAIKLGLFEDLHLFYYFKGDYQGENSKPIPEGDAFREFVLSRDLIVIDLFEIQLDLLDHGFSKAVNQTL